MSVFMRSISGKGHRYHMIFMGLVVFNMVAAFQALGTLMALGMIMMPAIAARFWAREIAGICGFASFFAFISSYVGLILSYHYSWPTGPSIILIGSLFYICSFIGGRYGSLRQPRL